ncbi:hypothetical protein ElyMa_004780500 [Elysia marginata]|uniref:Homeobox domain-containing protein n=1 Tax=Elysia marginata TaxID=1093978 RepID=A0AAV4IIJ7_9GAST|nr:hypothetical protein ElyMa_004780500 [Elysia marginata]
MRCYDRKFSHSPREISQLTSAEMISRPGDGFSPRIPCPLRLTEIRKSRTLSQVNCLTRYLVPDCRGRQGERTPSIPDIELNLTSKRCMKTWTRREKKVIEAPTK